MVSDGLLVMHGFVFCQELTDFFGGLGVVERLIGTAPAKAAVAEAVKSVTKG